MRRPKLETKVGDLLPRPGYFSAMMPNKLRENVGKLETVVEGIKNPDSKKIFLTIAYDGKEVKVLENGFSRLELISVLEEIEDFMENTPGDNPRSLIMRPGVRRIRISFDPETRFTEFVDCDFSYLELKSFINHFMDGKGVDFV